MRIVENMNTLKLTLVFGLQLGDAPPPPHVRVARRGQPRVKTPLLDPRLRASGEDSMQILSHY